MERVIEIDPVSLKEFKADLKELIKSLDSQDLNMYRAKQYRKFTIEMGKAGRLGLKERSALTEYMAGAEAPLYVTGKLFEHMRVKPGDKKSAEAGYFGGDGEVPSIGEKKLTYTDLAILHHTGYRVPLQGEKGQRVRRWFLACYGVRFASDKQWLVVPPRPFMFKSCDEYENGGEDVRATENYIEKVLKGKFD